MNSFGAVAYASSAFAFFVFIVLLLTRWRGRIQGGALLLASLLTVLWSAIAAYHALSDYPSSLWLAVIELVRDSVWLGLLIVLLYTLDSERRYKHVVRNLFLASAFTVGGLSLLLIYAAISNEPLPGNWGYDIRVFCHVVIAVLGLVVVEQLFRNSTQEQRWSIKYLCLGIGGLFAYDFYLYADALLLKQINLEIWQARGFINALVVPLLAITAARNPKWSLDVFVSRRFVFHTTTLMVASIYLLAMAAGGYYIKLYGGDWGGVAQLTFLFGAVMLLGLLMFSGQIKARTRVFLAKHFFSYRYDYREEWLRFINTLSDENLKVSFRERVIKAVVEIVESPGGILWQIDEHNQSRMVGNLNLSIAEPLIEEDYGSIVEFLQRCHWVIDIDEYRRSPDLYEGLNIPDWFVNLPQAWVILPLLQQSSLYGYLLLAEPRAKMRINWEDRDLLLTVARQAANYLALIDANEALIDARQFEAFNRLSAYVVHDLKNIVAQLSLVVSNAVKFKRNPEFVDDAISTVDNAVEKMDRMLDQFRKDKSLSMPVTRTELIPVVISTIEQRKVSQPAPQYINKTNKPLFVAADEDRLSSVLSHLVQNAQEATDDHGYVQLIVSQKMQMIMIEIRDNGSGMEQQFIRERLFRPFDTTKGNAGMGIGVYESREFIQSIGGRMEVISTPGEGTTFTIYMPIDDKDEKSGHTDSTVEHNADVVTQAVEHR